MVYLLAVQKSTFLPTGLARLDSFLAGGWPTGALSELTGKDGAGKTLLALRTAAHLTKRQERVALINPGGTIFPPALAAEGLDLPFLLWLRPVENERCRWAAEQVVRSGLFPLVMIRSVSYDERGARRLQLTSEATGTAVLFLTSQAGRMNPWAFSLRIRIERSALRRVRVQVLKSRNLLFKTDAEVSLDETSTDLGHSLLLSPLSRVAS
jgi:hypothetical protein